MKGKEKYHVFGTSSSVQGQQIKHKKQQKEENRKQVSTIVSNYTMSFENRRLDCVIHAKRYFYHKGKYEVRTFKSQEKRAELLFFRSNPRQSWWYFIWTAVPNRDRSCRCLFTVFMLSLKGNTFDPVRLTELHLSS